MNAQDNPLLVAIQLQQSGKLAEAEDLFRRLLAVEPTHPAVLYSLAALMLNSGRVREALPLAETGVAAHPGFAPLWFVHGGILKALNRREEALASFDRALAIDPNHVETLLHSGVLLHELHQKKEALLRFNRAIELDPTHETVLGNYGILLSEFKLGPEAVAVFERLLAKNPDYQYIAGLLVYERMHHCDWTDLEALTERITNGIREGKPTCKTLAYMALSDSAEDHFRCAKIFAANHLPQRHEPLWRGERYRHDRLRIAYVSPDLREHPVGHLMAGVFEAHDKSRFETIGISLTPDDGSRLRARMLATFDRFVDAQSMHSLQIAQLMREMEVDIAIDLAGYTSDSRSEIFLHRPAPVQINYLGYPGTMALECYDYILADRTVIPEDHQAWYSEKVAYLDHCYLPVASGVEVAEPQPRSAYGLPEKGFVFCAFSHDYKLHPALFAVWMRLLKAHPGSVLWLVSRNEHSIRNLRQAAEAEGIDPGRLVFATRVPRIEDHLARYRVADLFLDTWPYNAHTTAADALLAGLPVLTYTGSSFPSRVASSLLHTFGMDELVTHSFEEYFQRADELVRKPKKLKALRKRLAPEALVGHPFLGESFTRNLERALEQMVPDRAEPDPAEKAEAFRTEHMAGRPWAAAQASGSLDLEQTFFPFLDRILELNPSLGILLLAEEDVVLRSFQRRYGERVLCLPEARMGHRLAQGCQYFLGSRSSRTALALVAEGHWPEGFVFLFGGEAPPARETACRLCGGSLGHAFSRSAEGREVGYATCGTCGALQAEEPQAAPRRRPDPAAATHILARAFSLHRALQILGIRPQDRCVDVRGEGGLLARQLRDLGYDFHLWEPEGDGGFGAGIRWSALDRPVRLVTLLDQAFTEPAVQWAALFAAEPEFILGTMALYTGQGPEWAGLGSGDFFHAPATLAHVATQRGWSAYLLGEYVLLCRVPLADPVLEAFDAWVQDPMTACRQGFEAWCAHGAIVSRRDAERLALYARLRESRFRLAVDGQFFGFRFGTGIARVWASLLAEWSANGFGEFVVVLDRERTAPRLPGISYVDIPPHSYADLPGDQRMLQSVCDREGVRLFVSTYYSTPCTTPSVLMVHDMIPEVLGADLQEPMWQEKHRAIGYASHFIAVSHSTAHDLRRFFPAIPEARITTIKEGTTFRPSTPPELERFRQRHGIDRPFFLISGAKNSYKNALLFFKAFATLGEARSRFGILCTNSSPVLEPEFAACVGEGHVYLGRLSDEELQCAYSGALALAYPSRYEGFGLPILEAMACGCPVITCRNSSLGEVAGDAALYVDPDDVDGMRQALLQALDPQTRQRLVAEGLARAATFTWQETARAIEDILSNLPA